MRVFVCIHVWYVFLVKSLTGENSSMVSSVSATHTPNYVGSSLLYSYSVAGHSTVSPKDSPVTSGDISKHKSLSPDIISKYLVQYVPVKPNTRSRTATRVSGSRVLTSAEGLLMLQEKEEKKKKELEEKERRKQQRDDKKKEKESLAKKKSEEKLRKVNERKKTVAKKPSIRRNQCTSGGASSSGESSAQPSRSVSSSTASNQDPLNTDQCCECLRLYSEDVRMGTGAEWVECVCGRWLHEECIDSIEYNASGKEKLCSFCVI